MTAGLVKVDRLPAALGVVFVFKAILYHLKGISPTVNSSGQWIYGNNNTPSSIYGVNQDYLEIRQLSVSEGEMFTDADIKSSAKVCILGQTVVDNLFPDGSDPVGKVVRFNAIPFRVVGL